MTSDGKRLATTDHEKCIDCGGPGPWSEFADLTGLRVCKRCAERMWADCHGMFSLSLAFCERCAAEKLEILRIEQEAEIMAEFGYRHPGGHMYRRT